MSSNITGLPKIVVKERPKGINPNSIPLGWKILLAVLSVILIIYAWLVTSMTNVSEAWFRDEFIYGDDPKDEFSIVKKKKFDWNMVKMGEDVARNNTRLLVVSLVRNCSGSIPCMEKKLAVLGSVFKEVHMVFFENNSRDNTRQELLKYVRGEKIMGSENVKVTLVNPFTMAENEEVCASTDGEFQNNDKAGLRGATSGRIGRMTYLRNRALNWVYRNQENYDMLLMTDMDIIGRIFPTGIKETVGHLHAKKGEIGFVTFRGFFPSGGFFDPFSYRGTDIFSQTNFTTLLLCMKGYYLMPSGQGMQQVSSSHSGGIFANLPLPPRLRYSCEHVLTIPFVTDVHLCEHVTLMEKVPNNFVNTNMSFLVKDNV